MLKTRPLSAGLAILTAFILGGCPAIIPSIAGNKPLSSQTSQVTSQMGTLSLTIQWPKRELPGYNTQTIPNSTNAFVIWVRDGNTLLDKRTVARTAGATATDVKIDLKAGNNYSIEAKCYRETNPDPDVHTAIAQANGTVNIRPSQVADTTLTLDALFVPSVSALNSNVGQSGDYVTLTGDRFVANDSEVRFNGTLAPASDTTVTSSSSITVKVPTGATTGRISVKADGIESVSNAVYWIPQSVNVSNATVKATKTIQLSASTQWMVKTGEAASSYGSAPSEAWIPATSSVGVLNDNGTLLGYNSGTIDVQAQQGSMQSAPTPITVIEPTYTVSTIVGFGGGDGEGTNSAIPYPTALAHDSDGNIFFVDRYYRIRKITLSGTVSTFAGSGNTVTLDGTGTSASFGQIADLSVGSSGNLYVLQNDYTVRKITQDGVVTTICTLNANDYVQGIDVGESDNIYYFTYDGRIIKRAPDGTITPIAGTGQGGCNDGPGQTATFQGIADIAHDAAGNIYVADSGNLAIRKIDTNGNVTTFAGSGVSGSQDGQGTAASFDFPIDLDFDESGNLYVADLNNQRIRKILPDGTVSTLAGSTRGYQEGQGSAAQFDNFEGVCATGGNVYVSDRNNCRIRKIDSLGITSTFAGNGQSYYFDGSLTNAILYRPLEVIEEADSLVFMDYNGIRKINNGQVSTLLPETEHEWYGVTGANGRYYYFFDGQNVIYCLENGTSRAIAGSATNNDCTDGQGTAASFNSISDLAMDGQGNLIILDSNHIRKMTPDGTVTTIATNVSFNALQALSVNAQGNIYVVDLSNSYFSQNWKLCKITPEGQVSTLLDSLQTNGENCPPFQLASDANGFIYLTDTEYPAVLRINPDGTIVRIAGDPNVTFSKDGEGQTARFNRPTGINFDSQGNLLLCDEDLIRKITIQ